MSNIIGIDPDQDYRYDPQQAKPAGWCPMCGGEICGDTELCRRCQEEMDGADESDEEPASWVKISEEEYRTHPAISRSELWRLHDSPEKFRHEKDHPGEPTPALIFGQMFHKLALEPETFYEEFTVAPRCDRRIKDGKAIWNEFLAASIGKTVVTEDDYERASAMVASVMSHPDAVKLLDGHHEVSFFWTDDYTGEECKCRADCLCTSYRIPIVVDLKTAEDASTDGFARHAVNYGYDFQAAYYGDGIAKNIGQMPLFVFITVEKKPPYAVNILQADDLFIQRGRRITRELLDTYHYCKESDDWYGYLGRENKINILSLPAWAAREME